MVIIPLDFSLTAPADNQGLSNLISGGSKVALLSVSSRSGSDLDWRSSFAWTSVVSFYKYVIALLAV